MTDAGEARGGCLCGAVRYRARRPLRDVIYCHCSQCRRSSGHFVAATAVAPDALQFDRHDGLTWYASSASAERGFCSRCGASLFWRPADGAHVSIMAGTLDTPTGLVAREHLHVGAAGDYYRIDDRLPKYQQGHSDEPLQ